MTPRIVLLDETGGGQPGLAAFLSSHGLVAECCAEAPLALLRLAAEATALLLIRHRPGSTGDLDLLRRIRAGSAQPVILFAMDRDHEHDRVLALELGADDYIPASTGRRELLARIRAVFRRSQQATAAAAPPPSPQPVPAPAGQWRLCLRQRELFTPDGAARGLTSTEFEMLQALVRQQGRPVTREALSQLVLRRPYHPEDRALDNLVLRIRRKLGDEGEAARLIKSVRGIGYVFTGFPAAQGAPQAEETARPAAMPQQGRVCRK